MAERKTGISVNRKREKPRPEVDLTTPHGAQITVSAARAANLLKRPPLRLGDGSARKYVPAGEDPVIPPEQTGARAPRTGNRENTEE